MKFSKDPPTQPIYRFPHLIAIVVAMLATAATLPTADGQIHRWTDENGNVHFGDRPPANQRSERVEVRPNVYSSPTVEPLQKTFQTDDKGGRKVVMYSAEWCVHCKRAKAYFEKNGVAFVEYDVETSAKGKRDYKKLGAAGVPVILVGTERLNGFSATAFEAIYRKR